MSRSFQIILLIVSSALFSAPQPIRKPKLRRSSLSASISHLPARALFDSRPIRRVCLATNPADACPPIPTRLDSFDFDFRFASEFAAEDFRAGGEGRLFSERPRLSSQRPRLYRKEDAQLTKTRSAAVNPPTTTPAMPAVRGPD